MRGGVSAGAGFKAQRFDGRQDRHRMAVTPYKNFRRHVGAAKTDQVFRDIVDFDFPTIACVSLARGGEELCPRREPVRKPLMVVDHRAATQHCKKGQGCNCKKAWPRSEQSSI